MYISIVYNKSNYSVVYKSLIKIIIIIMLGILDETGCPWMSRNVKNRINVYSLIQNLHLPINSLDVQQNSVLCGCDNEAIYLIRDFTIS